MSYAGSMSLASFYMISSVDTQSISAGLFEQAISSQHVFHSQSKIPSIGGKTSMIFNISLLADADASFPTASVSIANADVISTRVGSQIAVATFSSQRSYLSTNPFISTKSPIELSTAILDDGDRVYLNTAIFLMLPIKD
jgi:hypothetical protein